MLLTVLHCSCSTLLASDVNGALVDIALPSGRLQCVTQLMQSFWRSGFAVREGSSLVDSVWDQTHADGGQINHVPINISNDIVCLQNINLGSFISNA